MPGSYKTYWNSEPTGKPSSRRAKMQWRRPSTTITSTSTQLTDDQHRFYVPMFLPSGNASHRQITETEIAQAAAYLPAGARVNDARVAVHTKHTQSGRHKTMA